MKIRAHHAVALALVQGCFSPNASVESATDDDPSTSEGETTAAPTTDPETGGPTAPPASSSGQQSTSSDTTDESSSTSDSTTGDPDAECGDGVPQGDEACDDGELNGVSEMTDCLSDCTLTTCGDGFVGLPDNEQCDQGDGNADDGACTSACAIAICGDNLTGPGESCDDGPAGSDECTAECALTSCGDGIVQRGEDCDDENDNSTDACVNCVAASCGDGSIQAGEEQCDDGAGNASEPPVCAYGVTEDECTYCAVDSCSLEIGVTSYCGDGTIQDAAGETCDGTYANATCNDCQELSCADGYADCDEDLANGCEVDLTTTATSCGSCGHSCLEGECSDAECQPYALYAAGGIHDIVVDEDSVYFITDSTAERIPQSPTASSTVLATGLENTTTSNFDQNAQYVVTEWGTNEATNAVVRVPKAGGATLDVYVPGDDGYTFISGPTDIAVASNRIYWTFTGDETFTPPGYFLRSSAINGGTIRTFVSDSPDPIGAIEATSSTIFWSAAGDTDALLSRPSGGGLITTTVRENLTSCNSMVAGVDRLYFSCTDGATSMRTLFATDFDGANEEILLTSADAEFEDGTNLALSEDELVWNDDEGPFGAPDPYVRTVRIDGTDARTVRAGVFYDGVDSEAYFWEASDEIWMLAK